MTERSKRPAGRVWKVFCPEFRCLGLNLPNFLTLLRITLVPLILALLAWNGPWSTLLAGAIFVVAVWTDNFDGYLARKWGQITDMGKFLDPIADKLLVDLLLIWFVAHGAVSVWLVLLVVAREFMVSGLRLVAAGRGVVLASDLLGKFKAVSQMMLVCMLIVQLQAGVLVFGWLAVLLTVGSAVVFFKDNYKLLRAEGE
jgi:CDP-diacylglycerol--glycerol-3-phosphate 3-phosphatidyltransferase